MHQTVHAFLQKNLIRKKKSKTKKSESKDLTQALASYGKVHFLIVLNLFSDPLSKEETEGVKKIETTKIHEEEKEDVKIESILSPKENFYFQNFHRKIEDGKELENPLLIFLTVSVFFKRMVGQNIFPSGFDIGEYQGMLSQKTR